MKHQERIIIYLLIQKFKENFINVFKYIEVKKKKEITFKYISNLKITNNNIKEIVSLGRKR